MEKILILCGNIASFIIKYSGTFEEDGSFFVTGYFAGEDGHFHSRMSTVLGILYYAAKTGDKNIIETVSFFFSIAPFHTR